MSYITIFCTFFQGYISGTFLIVYEQLSSCVFSHARNFLSSADTPISIMIAKIAISPETWAEASSGKHERFETMLFNVVNGALKNVKKTTQEHMAKMMQQSGGMGGLFGK